MERLRFLCLVFRPCSLFSERAGFKQHTSIMRTHTYNFTCLCPYTQICLACTVEIPAHTHTQHPNSKGWHWHRREFLEWNGSDAQIVIRPGSLFFLLMECVLYLCLFYLLREGLITVSLTTPQGSTLSLLTFLNWDANFSVSTGEIGAFMELSGWKCYI